MTFFRQVPILTSAFHQYIQKKVDVPSQHVTLLGIFDDQDQLINTVDLVFDTLNQRTESIGNIIDKGVRDPVRGNGNVIFELLNSASNILGMGCTSKVELFYQSLARGGWKGTYRECTFSEDDDVHVQRLEVGLGIRILVERSETD